MRLLSLLLTLITTVGAAAATWQSSTTETALQCTVTNPKTQAKDASGRKMTVVYLENLSCEKIGQNTNADDVAWLAAQGYTVIEVDYAHHANAVAPKLNKDIIKINDELNSGSFAGVSSISTDRAYILFEGYRISRDVSYYLDDPTVYNLPDTYAKTKGDSLYMDIVYPANPSKAVPTVLSFSYSNSYDGKEHKRMFLGYTLSMFDDSILEGLPGIGMAWAIADHPKYCDWGNGKYTGGANKSLASVEVNPDAARKVKCAVRTLRGFGKGVGLGNDIALYGFSRGSTAASLGIGNAPKDGWMNTTRCNPIYAEENSDIQAAVLGPGVFDYSKMASGSRELTNMTAYCNSTGNAKEAWAEQGGALSIGTSAVPCFLFYNSDDDANYGIQTTSLMEILKSKGVTTQLLKDYGTGHSVPQKAEDLSKIYSFLKDNLTTTSGIKKPKMRKRKSSRKSYDLTGRAVSLTSSIYIADGRKFVKAPTLHQ